MQPIGMRRFLLFLLFTAPLRSLSIEIQNNTCESALARAIVGISSDVYTRDLTTLHFIETGVQQDDIITEILSNVRTSLAYTVEHMEEIATWYPRWFNIIFIGEVKDFIGFAKKLNDTYFDPRGFYIVVVETVVNPKTRHNWSRVIFKTFFALFYDNVITLFRDESGATVFMYTFFPCDPTHACYEVVPVLFNTFDGEHFTRKVLHFQEKWKNLNGCPITIGVNPNIPFISYSYIPSNEGDIQVEGIDGTILRMVAYHLNFTIDYKMLTVRGSLDVNGTVTGSYYELLNGKISLMVGGYTPNTNLAKVFSNGVPYLKTALVYALSVPLEIGSLERHVFPLKKEIWIVCFGLYCSAFICLTILKRFRPRFYHFIAGAHSHSPFLDMIEIFLEVSVHRIPGKTFARSLFGIWLLSTFIISSSYRGRLVEILTSRSPETIPQTIEEFNSMDYEIIVRPVLYHYMAVLYKNSSRIKPMTNTLWSYFSELQISSGRRRAIVDTGILVDLFNARNYRNGVLPVLHEKLTSVTVCILFKKNSYFVQPFDKLLQYFGSGGLIDKWIKEVINFTTAKKYRATIGLKPLNLTHFEGTFELYAIGIGIAVLMFLLELISLRYNALRRFVQFYTE